MKQIKFIISDIDGCIADFIKPEFPLKQDLSENLSNLESIYKSIRQPAEKDFPSILFGVATARSFYQSDHIMEATGFQGPSIFEMGNVIFDPQVGVFNLFEFLDKFKKHKVVINEFLDWRRKMFVEKILEGKMNGILLKPMMDRTMMVTYEFENGLEQKILTTLESLMPDTIRRAIQEKILKVLVSKGAIDILPNINKGEALDYLLKIKQIDKNQVFAVGDSLHSDYDLLESAGIVGCPANADIELINYVKNRGGLISAQKSTAGLIDLISQLKNL